ncbi:hypothetical protein TNCV_2365231 [Trichonephila clavipes]|nr:hypothetical protein TNCV_2365231 [Trichonephila clavipes]
MLRPIQRVYPLEVQSTETPNDPLNDCTITNPISSISSDNLSDPNDSSNVLPRVSKYGRVIKVPEKLDHFNQYGLSTISGLPLHDDKGRYRPEKSMTDSPKDLSQLVAFQCNPWLFHCSANDVKSSNTMRRHATPYHHFCRVLYCGLQTLMAEFRMSASSYIGTTLVARNTN